MLLEAGRKEPGGFAPTAYNSWRANVTQDAQYPNLINPRSFCCAEEQRKK